MTSTVLPGKVDWTGDNPFIYLKTDPTGDWSSLSVFFRITASDHGTGHLTAVVTDPYDPERASALGLTDNEPLARFLIEDFVSKFVLFRPTKAFESVKLHTNAEFSQDITDTAWVERARDASAGVEVAMQWDQLQPSFAVHQPAAESGTGRHEMLSVFLPAGSAVVTVNGTALPGATVERDFFGGRAQSAALALSETWVQA
ncbi:hypothetical protein A5733_10490 [Mycobacterium sp. NS-7484]|uniref:hypothetical protein n=1 Tax=Mycobacterium sp. NS-7484 TaxID=1834161 RepID=UPI00096D8D8A|nr:hypothetical protein [Mycobacterium sp. NS-7484]OMB97177.1 hypothetical protein A5733_10490 [Mycobacterium sp. NS-7484]